MLEAEGGTDVRTVDGLVAAGGPAGAATEEGRMVASADQDDAWGGLLLEVTLQTEVGVAGLEHLRVHGAVRIVAGDAAFAGGFVLEDVGAGLGSVTFDATAVDAVKLRSAFGDRSTLVRVVTVTATHLAVHHGMAEGEIEFAALIQVTLEAGLRRVAGIDDRAGLATRFYVERGRAVAGLATDFGAVAAWSLELGVGGIMEGAGEMLVTLNALLRADVGCSGHLGRCDDGTFGHHAGNEKQAPKSGASEEKFAG